MHLKSITVQNFRRLKNCNIDLNLEKSIFVGANNSGKTSATHLLYRFLGDTKSKFTIHDFSSDCWAIFDAIGNSADEPAIDDIPKITLDLWFDVSATDLHRVLDLLPSLDWEETPIGARIEFCVKDVVILISNYRAAKATAVAKSDENYHPWPKSLTDYLLRNINEEFGIKYFVLDHTQFDAQLNQVAGYTPLELGNETDRNGGKILKSIIKVDVLNAQRHLSDYTLGRSEDLSKRINKFYERNLRQKEDNFEALRALDNSEKELTAHLSEVFEPTLQSLNNLAGYPGFQDPKLLIKAALNSENIAAQTKLHYSLSDEPDSLALPDQYNGLGFKNLIFMVIEILDFHARWMDDKENRAPLHLIIIEEPEVHLHAQLQQVFIKQIQKVIMSSEETNAFVSQLIITTHSPHIIYESGFEPIRYFRRETANTHQTTKILNLSTFYDNSKPKTRDFLQQYMKLTHCDLFFADAAILVEGNVERLLLPLMIQKSAPDLNTCYISVIEVGGAFAHIFKSLINFLGLTTLIITDIDSIYPVSSPLAEIHPAGAEQKAAEKAVIDPEVAGDEPVVVKEVIAAPNDDDDDDDFDYEEENEDEDEPVGEEVAEKPLRGKCPSQIEACITSNQTLIKWLPKLQLVSELFAANEQKRTQLADEKGNALVHVCYQSQQSVTWEGETAECAGRTIEESFALENLAWTQNILRKKLRLRVITNANNRTLTEVRERLFERINISDFNKTDFALALMMENLADWNVPEYIDTGLKWLQRSIVKLPPPAPLSPPPAELVVEPKPVPAE
ncbi:ATP-dependent endonuclease [Flavobacterium sp. ASV13]|uniref:ATP-dependent nuclease n=1 Tax=Flavobacterium sp. ASV13 TaxID=1506583 RepID=UPI00068B7ADA|nr:ATP-dependent endonuclease [Flavobacterium sp. ASV13]